MVMCTVISSLTTHNFVWAIISGALCLLIHGRHKVTLVPPPGHHTSTNTTKYRWYNSSLLTKIGLPSGIPDHHVLDLYPGHTMLASA